MIIMIVININIIIMIIIIIMMILIMIMINIMLMIMIMIMIILPRSMRNVKSEGPIEGVASARLSDLCSSWLLLPESAELIVVLPVPTPRRSCAATRSRWRCSGEPLV